MKLNLGSGGRNLAGYLNVDIAPPADQIIDLSGPWPWEDSSIDEIVAEDIIEHLPCPIDTMNEAWRVLKPGGKFLIKVPSTDGRGAFQDPTHVSFWNYNSFRYYSVTGAEWQRFRQSYGIRAAFKILKLDERRHHDGVIDVIVLLEAIK